MLSFHFTSIKVLTSISGLPWWLSGKEFTCQGRRLRRCGFDPWFRKIPWRRKWQPTSVFLPGEFQTEEPGGLQFMGSQSVGHDSVTNTHTHTQLAYQYYSFKKYSLLHHLKNNALRDAETDRWKFTSLSPNRYLLVYWIQQSSSLFLCLQNSGSSLFCHKCATQLLYPSLWQFKSLHKHLWSALSRPGTVQGAGWRIHSPYSQEEGKRPLSKLIKAEPWNWLVPKDQGFILDSCRVLCLGHRKGVAHSAGMCEYSPW